MKLIECPRDAMQGLERFIPTEVKVSYLNQLLKVGFDTLDFGSFVSPKAIPQMRDTVEVVKRLDLSGTSTKLLAIVANTRGAREAVMFDEITYLGFPLSISETFQQRNTNKSISEALNSVAEIQELCQQRGKVLVTYISMGFGNPYGDPYDEEIVITFSGILQTLGVSIISLADTIGVSRPDQIKKLFSQATAAFPAIEFGAHLHSAPATALEKIEAVYKSGCQRFDGALKGFGGCPMAEDELVGNLATEAVVSFLKAQGENLSLNEFELMRAFSQAALVFGSDHA
ncbi:MAG: hydroxymethylglutaryl-CoA lyase [Cyclobacteriaceae bacterium]